MSMAKNSRPGGRLVTLGHESQVLHGNPLATPMNAS